jgi:hypothetical protein
MTIAIAQFEAIGARIYNPEGPFGAAGGTPLPSFKVGTVAPGDCGSEFVYVLFAPVASVTLNQGDVLVWDNSFTAVLSATGSGAHVLGANVGTFYLGGRVGDPAAANSSGNYWSWTFAAGVYGIWVQRSGISLANIASINAQSKPVNTTAVAGRVDQPATALSGSMGIGGMFSAATSLTFTANTTTGSATLAAVSSNKFLVKGQLVTGTGIPTGTVILDIQGSSVTMSKVATATNTGTTVTAANNSSVCTTTNGSAVLTNVVGIAGIYPNQTITGTGIPGSTTILSIQGNAAPYQITLSANATATADNIAIATVGYYETILRWPTVGVQN